MKKGVYKLLKKEKLKRKNEKNMSSPGDEGFCLKYFEKFRITEYEKREQRSRKSIQNCLSRDSPCLK